DPDAARAKVDELRSTVEDPQGAATDRVSATADAQVSESTGVRVEGSVSTPPVTPKK
ncbi:MAG: hypothetical protein H7138_07920, partial [Myxococcales bacterium]|nr:hypothetical protein [Myxococcales bacterium]